MNREQAVRERAYEIWDAEGRPLWRAQEHWDRAVREINKQATEPSVADDAGTSDAAPPSSLTAAAEPIENPASPVPAAKPKRAARKTTKPLNARGPRTKADKTPA